MRGPQGSHSVPRVGSQGRYCILRPSVLCHQWATGKGVVLGRVRATCLTHGESWTTRGRGSQMVGTSADSNPPVTDWTETQTALVKP